MKRLAPLAILLLFATTGICIQLLPSQVIWLFSLATVLCVLLLLWLTWSRKISWQERLALTLFAALLFTTGLSFFVFLEQQVFIYGTIVVVAIILALYTENVYRYLYSESSYQVSAITNIASYMAILILFFGAVTLFDLRVFFALSLYVFSIASCLLSVLLAYSLFSLSRIPSRQNVQMTSIFALIYLELMLATTIWPIIPLSKGIVTMAISYASIQALLLSQSEKIIRSKIMITILFTSAICFLALVTAQWR